MVADRGYDIEGIIAMAQLRIEVSFVIELSETMLPVVWRMVFAFGVQQRDMALHAKAPVLGLVIDCGANAEVKLPVLLLPIEGMRQPPVRSPMILLAVGPEGKHRAALEDDSLSLLSAKMILHQNGEINVGRRAVARVLVVMAETFQTQAHTGHQGPSGVDVVVDAVTDVEGDILLVLFDELVDPAHSLVDVVLPTFALSTGRSR